MFFSLKRAPKLYMFQPSQNLDWPLLPGYHISFFKYTRDLGGKTEKYAFELIGKGILYFGIF